MTLTAEIVLRSSSLPLISIPASLQTVAVEYVHRRRIRSGCHLYIIQLDARDDISEADLSALDEVVDTTNIGRASRKDIYRLNVELADDIVRVFDTELDGAPMENPIITAEGWHENKVFKNYNSLSEFQATCEDNGISVEIISLSSRPVDSSEATTYGLTERQHEALTLALSRGYYESPRQVSTEELAAELGITQPSMSNLLRRAEHQLLSSTLSPQRHVNDPSS